MQPTKTQSILIPPDHRLRGVFLFNASFDLSEKC